MSATDDEKLPWLAAEKRLIAEAVEADRLFWGGVPAYVLERLIVQLEKGADQMTGHARTLFER